MGVSTGLINSRPLLMSLHIPILHGFHVCRRYNNSFLVLFRLKNDYVMCYIVELVMSYICKQLIKVTSALFLYPSPCLPPFDDVCRIRRRDSTEKCPRRT